ncbi:MAG: right-handed parallel beta-helix repeat-containing protein, partial [Spirochaetes bacterium]|nr:right-handed parallel beta-helix repeat-containing protein [Spirochaetota bacterium]
TNHIWGSNQIYGICITNGDNNIIRSNQIHQQSCGIYFTGTASSNYIHTNLIYINSGKGIVLYDSAQYNEMVNNAIFNNNEGIAIYSNCEFNRIYKNRIYNNTNTSGIFIDSRSNTISQSNRIYRNKYGLTIGGPRTEGWYNTVEENLIYSNYRYGVYLNGNNNGNDIKRNRIFGPSQYKGVVLANADANTVQSNWIYRNDESGVWVDGWWSVNNMVLNNNVYSNSSYGIEALGNYSHVRGNRVYGPGQDIGIYYYAWRGDISQSNYVYKNDRAGIFVTNSEENDIRENSIYLNGTNGIWIVSGMTNTIKHNEIWSNTRNGIYMSGGYDMTIKSNNLFKNGLAGLWLDGVGKKYFITNNQINSNTAYGLYLDGAGTNIIMENSIFGSQDRGIYVKSANNLIKSNLIRDAVLSGIVMTNYAPNTKVFQNRIVYNKTGITFKNTTSCSLFRNAIFRNSEEGILLENGDEIEIINNSIASNGYAATRDGLKVDSSCEDVIIKNNIIVHSEGYGLNVEGGGNVDILTYNDIFSNLAGDYNGITPGTGAITNDPIWLSYEVNSSNFLYLSNQSPCIDTGDPADPVPSLGGLYVDMGWKEFEKPMVRVLFSKSITNIKLGGADEDAIPGTTIEYKIVYRVISYGNENTDKMIIYDHIDDNTTYATGYLGSAAGFTQEYSTNDVPDQTYNSANYDQTRPAKDKIKWVRWKKISEGGGTEKNIFLKIIIK